MFEYVLQVVDTLKVEATSFTMSTSKKKLDKIAKTLSQASEVDLKKKVDEPEITHFKSELTSIKDTFWHHTDPQQLLDEWKNLSKYEKRMKKESDVIYKSKLFKCAVIPFSVRCPELVLDVAPYLEPKKRKVITSSDEVITDLSPEGIEWAFGWSNKGIPYAYGESQLVYAKANPKPLNLLRSWLKEEYRGESYAEILKAQRSKFNAITNVAISFLCRVTGKEDDGKFIKDFKSSDGARSLATKLFLKWQM